jgi:hypothetical protein
VQLDNLFQDEVTNLSMENQRKLAFLKEDRHRVGVRANGQSFSVLDGGADDGIDYDNTGDSLDDDASFLHSGKNLRTTETMATQRGAAAAQNRPSQRRNMCVFVF